MHRKYDTIASGVLPYQRISIMILNTRKYFLRFYIDARRSTLLLCVRSYYDVNFNLLQHITVHAELGDSAGAVSPAGPAPPPAQRLRLGRPR